MMDMDRIKEITIELAAYAKAMRGADEATFKVMAAHVDELCCEQMRVMGLPEEVERYRRVFGLAGMRATPVTV